MNQQELVWIRLAFSNLEERKVRPAVIVSNNEYNKRSDDVIICAITSRLKEDAYGITIDSRNLASGKLPIKSRIRADKILQVEKSLIINSFAKLDNRTFDELTNKIMKLVKRT